MGVRFLLNTLAGYKKIPPGKREGLTTKTTDSSNCQSGFLPSRKVLIVEICV
jgi:hypothetical protein